MALFVDSPFLSRDDSVSIMDGTDEEIKPHDTVSEREVRWREEKSSNAKATNVARSDLNHSCTFQTFIYSTLPSSNQHPAFIKPAPCLHQTNTLPSSNQHPAFIKPAPCLHQTSTLSSSNHIYSTLPSSNHIYSTLSSSNQHPVFIKPHLQHPAFIKPHLQHPAFIKPAPCLHQTSTLSSSNHIYSTLPSSNQHPAFIKPAPCLHQTSTLSSSNHIYSTLSSSNQHPVFIKPAPCLHQTTSTAPCLHQTSTLSSSNQHPAFIKPHLQHPVFIKPHLQHPVFIKPHLQHPVFIKPAPWISAWITVNFLTGDLNRAESSTAGMLDLGGGSTQITFKPQDEKTIQTSPVDYISYLGLGLMSARLAVLGGAPPQVRWEHADVVYTVSGQESEDSALEACRLRVRRLLSGKVLKVEADDIDFYAFSFYYDRAAELGLIGEHTHTHTHTHTQQGNKALT
ncbi:hypothetical protein KUCAC02_035267 [Chaenocephalus aceratus]|nr:hypothetical protein KUCAC02_035267 [Chaenocephalus aceratus]